MPDTNWLWFRVFGNLGLAKVGAPHDRERMLKDLDHLDTFYLGDGWSRDGPEGVRQLDYYSESFAIQYAQLVYAKLAGDEDQVRAKEYKERAARFAVDFVHYFDEDGAAIPFGRSTTYRMAMAAFWAALAFTFTPEDMSSLFPPYLSNPGVIKGLLFRNLRWWSKHHESIFNSDGTLSIGYVYPNMYFTENYNSPGPPYWGMKAFLVLALPAHQPFWTSEELPHPFSVASTPLPVVYPIKHPLHIMVRAKYHTYLLSTGQACHYPLKATQAKYGKFSYSATFGFCVPTGGFMLDQHALDGIIGFSDDGGEVWRSRRIVDNPRIEMMGEGTWPVLAGAWDVFGDGEVKCETWLVPPPPTAAGMETGKEHWYVRVHRVSIAPGCRHLRDGKLLSAEASWAVYGQGSDARILTLTSASAASSEDSSESQSLPDVTSGAAYAVSVGGAVGLFPTSMGKRAAEVLAVDANASLIWPRTVLPTLRGGLGEGERWFVTGVFGRRVVRGWKREWDAVGEGWEGMVPAELRRRIVVG